MFFAAGLTFLYSHMHLFRYRLKNLELYSSSVDHIFSTREEAQISAQLIKLYAYHPEIPQFSIDKNGHQN